MKDDIVARIGFNGGVVEISEDVLCKHTIFIGSTGSGKTTSCNVLLRDLIRYKADDKERKIALIVFDFKGDGTLRNLSMANVCLEKSLLTYVTASETIFSMQGN